jgi:major vault protein
LLLFRTAVEQAELKAEASKIEIESEMNRLKARRDAELKYLSEKYELELHKAKQMAEIEIGRFKETVASLGADTIRAIATAGPELQVR